MARNSERDNREESRRRMRLIQVGFEMFSEKGIEGVSLQSIANAADVGASTMYKYFQSKANLLVEISAFIWSDYWDGIAGEGGLERLKNMDAGQFIEAYCDEIIGLYRNRPDVLRFSSSFKTYLTQRNTESVDITNHMAAMAPVDRLFHEKYVEAVKQGTIRSDLDEGELFTTVTLTMLGMAERYADGIVWAGREDNDYTRELGNVKEMLLLWINNNK